MRLVLHIGGAKCGSTAIQAVLRENAATLRSRGVLVPGLQLDLSSAVHGQQLRFFRQVVKLADGPAVVESPSARTRRHMDEVGLDTLVVSAENLINPDPFPDLFAGVDDLFDTQIIAYVRRQDDYFASGWQQWGLKRTPQCKHTLRRHSESRQIGRHSCCPGKSRFGRERIIVRRFQRSALKDGDVVSDFFSVTGLPLEACSRSNSLYNRSWDEHVGTMAHRVRDVFASQHDGRFFLDLFSVVGPSMFKNYPGSMLFTLDERREILAAYAASNDELRARYFPGARTR